MTTFTMHERLPFDEDVDAPADLDRRASAA